MRENPIYSRVKLNNNNQNINNYYYYLSVERKIPGIISRLLYKFRNSLGLHEMVSS